MTAMILSLVLIATGSLSTTETTACEVRISLPDGRIATTWQEVTEEYKLAPWLGYCESIPANCSRCGSRCKEEGKICFPATELPDGTIIPEHQCRTIGRDGGGCYCLEWY